MRGDMTNDFIEMTHEGALRENRKREIKALELEVLEKSRVSINSGPAGFTIRCWISCSGGKIGGDAVIRNKAVDGLSLERLSNFFDVHIKKLKLDAAKKLYDEGYTAEDIE